MSGLFLALIKNYKMFLGKYKMNQCLTFLFQIVIGIHFYYTFLIFQNRIKTVIIRGKIIRQLITDLHL